MNAIRMASTKDTPRLTFLVSTSIIVSIVIGIITGILTSALQTEFARVVAAAQERVTESPGKVTDESSLARANMVPKPVPAPTPDSAKGTPSVTATPGPAASVYQTPVPTRLPTPVPVAAPTSAKPIPSTGLDR